MKIILLVIIPMTMISIAKLVPNGAASYYAICATSLAIGLAAYLEDIVVAINKQKNQKD